MRRDVVRSIAGRPVRLRGLTTAEEEEPMRPVHRFRWDEAAYAEAFATLVRCAGERVAERQILREVFAAYPATAHAVDWGAGSGHIHEAKR